MGGAGGSVERDMVEDMGDDGEIGMEDDLFHPGF
jgi:hypothetical protein